jgi:HK97 gp10 family phage protein
MAQVFARMKLEGVDELQKAMKLLPPSVAKKHMRRAIRRGIVLVRDHIKSNAPIRSAASKRGVRRKQKAVKPGRLRRLVRVKSRRGKRGYLKVSLIYPTEGTSDNPKNAFYWRFVVDGFRHTSGVIIPGNDYIQRAVDQRFTTIVRQVITETNQGVKEALSQAGVKKA